MKKKPDCLNCVYKHFDQDDGHCYMFREPPKDFCAQFTKLQIKEQTK
jgi:hypothetical protein